MSELNRAISILASRTVPFGRFVGGPEDGVTFKRNWNSETMQGRDGSVYRINRERVERAGDSWAVIYEFSRGPANT